MSSSLHSERTKLSFDPTILAHYIYNGKDRYTKLMEMYRLLAEDPILKNEPSILSKGRIEVMKAMAQKTKRAHELFNLTESDPHFITEACTHQLSQFVGAIHILMFVPYIKFLGTPEQVEKWLPPALKYEIIGAYAQTELGHGS